MTTRLLAEAGIVAALLGALLWLVATTAPRALATPGAAALTGLAVGAAVHLAFEVTGLNRAYCTAGHACRA